MCGIGGIISLKGSFGKEKLEFVKQVCDNLLIGLSVRGTDATGVAHIRSDADNYAYRIYKQPKSASEFIKDEEYKATFGEDSNIVLLHTRAKTSGDPKNNKNNHPHYNKETGNIQVHNGVISMHEFLKNQHELKCDGECDSEVLLRMIEKFGFRKGLSKVSGSAAIALSQAQSRHLILYCSSNPLTIAYVPQMDLFVFASTMHILNDAMGQRETQSFNGLSMQKFTRYFDYYSTELDDETKVLFNMRKQKVSVEHKVKMDKTSFHSVGRYGTSRHGGVKWGGTTLYSDDLEDDIPVRYVLPKKKEDTSLEEVWSAAQFDTAATIARSLELGFTEDEVREFFENKFSDETYIGEKLKEYKEEKELQDREDQFYLRKAWKDCIQDAEAFVDVATEEGFEPADITQFLKTQKVSSNTLEKVMSDLRMRDAFEDEYEETKYTMDYRGCM